MFKEFLLKKLIQTKLGNIPKEDQDRILRIVTKNPVLFQEIATKIKHQMDSGKDQNTATMFIMKEYQSQIRALMAGD
jgi:hypothetical protein